MIKVGDKIKHPSLTQVWKINGPGTYLRPGVEYELELVDGADKWQKLGSKCSPYSCKDIRYYEGFYEVVE